MTDLKIPGNVYEQIIAHAQTETPVEACGILAGKGDTVERLYKMTNVDNSGVHFMMKPDEQFAVVKDIRTSGLEMLAVYHSHPHTPARLSQEDIRLSLTPDVTYVIVSLQDADHPIVKGFVVENGNADEVPVEIVEGQK